MASYSYSNLFIKLKSKVSKKSKQCKYEYFTKGNQSFLNSSKRLLHLYWNFFILIFYLILVESIVIPSLMDGVSGIGEILIDSFTEGISQLFEKKGFLAKTGKSKSGHTAYNEVSKRKSRYRDNDDDDEDDDDRSYDNIRVKTEREAKQVIAELREQIADKEYGYATVANLYELTDNMVTYTDHRYGWTSLNSATYVRTRNREKPWLLKLPRPKDLSDIK